VKESSSRHRDATNWENGTGLIAGVRAWMAAVEPNAWPQVFSRRETRQTESLLVVGLHFHLREIEYHQQMVRFSKRFGTGFDHRDGTNSTGWRFPRRDGS